MAKTARCGNKVARRVAKAARFVAKAARVGEDAAASRLPGPRVRWGAGGCLRLYVVVKVPAAPGGAALIELIYHDGGELASGAVVTNDGFPA